MANVNYEFLGRVTKHADIAAQAVCDAIESLDIRGDLQLCEEIVTEALNRLDPSWSPVAVYAVLRNCSFSWSDEK